MLLVFVLKVLTEDLSTRALELSLRQLRGGSFAAGTEEEEVHRLDQNWQGCFRGPLGQNNRFSARGGTEARGRSLLALY